MQQRSKPPQRHPGDPGTDQHPLFPEATPSDTALLALPEPIPTEVAFENIGYFTPASKRIKGITTKEKIVAERTNPDGTRTVLKVQIIGTGKYGLPITADLDYYRAFLKLLDEIADKNGHIPEPIPLPTRPLIRYAGKQVSAREFRAVTDWIRRSHYTGIQGFYYRADTGDYVEIGDEPLFPRYLIRGQRLENGTQADTHYVWLASWFRTNYLHHHLRPIDLGFHLRLRKPIAKSLYPLLELGWYATGGKPYTKSYRDLSQEFLLQDYCYLSQIKQQLDPAHRELAQERFLERWDYRPAAIGQTWIITYHPGPKFFADQRARESRRQQAARIATGARPAAPAPPDPRADLPPLLAEILAVCGDLQNQAAYHKVLRDYPEGLIQMALAETRHAAHEGRIRKTPGAYFMDTLQRLATLRATPATTMLEGGPELTSGTAPVAAQAAAPGAAETAAQEQRELAHARAHTEARLTQMLETFSLEQRQQLDHRATAQLPLREHDVGYGIMLRVAREAILLHEQLGFDCWPRLVAQVRARDGARAEDDVLETCRLEAIMDDILVVSVPTAQDKTQLTEHYLAVLEELASPPPQRRQIRVLVR
jgi:hypothetical protein